MNKYLAVFLVFVLVSCEDVFQYSPNVVSPPEENINARNILRIQQDSGASFRFIVIADIHHAYDDLREFVSAVNSMPDIRFVAVAGDLTNSGLQFEYDDVHAELVKLRCPYLAAIGNHDLLANGQLVYEKMYGKMDFSFKADGIKFVFLNTNSREFGFPGNVPDLNFLQQELSDARSYTQAFVVAHVPASDSDFDQNLSEAFNEILESGNVSACINGHQNRYQLVVPVKFGFYQVVSGDLEDRTFVLISVNESGVSIENRSF